MGVLKFSLLTFFFCLIGFELSLRILGQVYNPIDSESWIKDKEKKRILVIGESTTETQYEDDIPISWPEELERKLNSSKPDKMFKVYNVGLSGTTSLMVLSRMDEYLLTYNPDIVITMIGLNDKWLMRDTKLRYSETLLFKIKYQFKRLRLVKFLTWYYELFHASNIRLEGYVAEDLYVSDLVKQSKQIVQEKIELIKNDVQKQKIMFKALTIITREPKFKTDSERVHKERLEHLVHLGNYMRKGHVRDTFLYSVMLESIHDLDDYKLCSIVFKESFFSGVFLSDDMASYGIKCLSMMGEVNEKIQSFYNYGYKNHHYYENFIYHYRNIFKKVNEHGAKMIALQYANFPVHTLEYVFSKKYSKSRKTEIDFIYEKQKEVNYSTDDRFKKISIKSNESFSKKLKAKHSYSDLFIDHIFGGTGHFTTLGHKLFGHKIYRAIKDEI